MLSKKLFKIYFIFFILIIAYLRSPYIFKFGRFVAEEGEFWFRNSFVEGPLFGLTQVYFGSGYFNLWANISSVLALIPNLEYAPLITVYCAFFVQLFLYIFIIFHKSKFLVRDQDKYIICLLVLISPFMVEEVWLNTLASQVYLTILVILIFFQEETKSVLWEITSYASILVAGLSTITTNILTPFFFYKYKHNKSRINLINFLIIFISTLFQFFIYLYSKYYEFFEENLRYNISNEKFINFVYNVIFKNFFGRDFVHLFFSYFYKKENLIILSILIIFFILLALFFFIKKFKNDRIFILLLIFFIAESLLAFFGSKFNQVQGRYAVVPSFLLMTIVYRIYQISDNFIKKLSIILVIFSLTAGAYQYKYKAIYPEFLDCFDCPNWKEEILKWRNDNNYKIKIWNYPTRSMYLK